MCHRLSRMALWAVISIAVCYACTPCHAWRFASIGDTQGNENGVNVTVLTSIVNQINTENVEFVFQHGDAIDGYCDPTCTGSQFDTFAGVMNNLNCPWYYCPGNHCVGGRSDTEAVLRSKVEQPLNGPSGYEELVYSFDWKEAHTVALNSDHYGEEHHLQRSWLSTDLSNTYQPHKFVTAHETAYPEGPNVGVSLDYYPSERDDFWNILTNNNVLMYFCGHEHFFKRTLHGNVYQINNGTAGAFFYSAPGAIQEYHYVVVDISGYDVHCEARDETGALLDSWDYTISGEAPIVTSPAVGAVVTTTTPTIQWDSDSHDMYQVRVTRVNDPNTVANGWDSGQVSGSGYSATSGTLSDKYLYYAFVRVHDASGWGPWSPKGCGFAVNTSTSTGVVYPAEALPSASGWTTYDTGSYENGNGIKSLKVLDGSVFAWKLRDNSATNRCKDKYAVSDVNFDTGATVASRMRAVGISGTPTYNLGISNNGTGGMYLRVSATDVKLVDINDNVRGTYSLDGTTYHEYQLTVKNATPGNNSTALWRVYVDGAERISWTGAGTHDGFDGFMAGHAGASATGYWYFDWIAGRADGNYSPFQWDPADPSEAKLNVKPAGSITIDGNTGDWNLGEFSGVSRAGQKAQGDIALTGYDGSILYYAGYWTGGVLPTSAADHTAKVYSRHDATYAYFLVRCDDSDMRYSYPTSANWANDCVEFYIDPGHDHGSTSMSISTSDVQLVIDANNQKNVYMTTSGYASQVLSGVTSAVVRDGTGWWLEARVLKSALDPDMPASGSVGVDFNFRDNDNNNDAAQTTVYAWSDSGSGGGFPSKVPDRWGDLVPTTSPPDTTPPANVSSFTATAGAQQVALTWTNPSDADFTGTMIRFKTTGYPTSVTDGALVIDKSGTPGAADNYTHTGLTAGVTYYYKAFAHDGVPNYASGAQARATPTGGTAYDAQFISDTIPTSVVKSHQYDVQVTMKNTGTNTWTKANSYKLGGVNDSDPFYAPARVELATGDSIATNQQKAFSIWFTAPSSTGTYTTDWRMLREGVTWFGETDTKTVQVKDGVSINLGNTNINNNLTCATGGDGDNTGTTIGGVECRYNTNPNEDYYFYFKVSDSWAYQGSKPDVYIKLNYYDTGGGAITLQYDATSDPFKNGGSVTLGSTNTWRTYTWHVTDAYFGNRQLGSRDFRFFLDTGKTRYIDQVQVSTGSL